MQTRFGSGSERYRYARPTDIPSIVDMLADPEVGRWLWFVPAPAGAVEGYFKPLIDGQWQSLADGKAPAAAVFVVEDDDGGFLGNGGAMAVQGSTGGLEIGFQLVRAAWGRGVGTRLAQFLLAWSAHVHHAHRVQAGCLDGNNGSRRILEKLEMRLEGTRPQYRLKGDTRHTELEYGVCLPDLDADRLQEIIKRIGFEV